MAISPSPIFLFPPIECPYLLLPCPHLPFYILLSNQTFLIHWNWSCLSQTWVKPNHVFSSLASGHNIWTSSLRMLTSKIISFSPRLEICWWLPSLILHPQILPWTPDLYIKMPISTWKLNEHLEVNIFKTKSDFHQHPQNFSSCSIPHLKVYQCTCSAKNLKSFMMLPFLSHLTTAKLSALPLPRICPLLTTSITIILIQATILQ